MQSFKSGVNLGTITLTNTGKFQVDVSQASIAASTDTTVTAPTSRIDFSGAWTIAAFDGTLPTGFTTALTPGTTGCADINNCNGTPVGQPVYFMRLSGKKFTYTGASPCTSYKANHSGTCTTGDGTVDPATTVDAASIWGGASAIAACGYKLGFSQADALSGGGIDVEPADLPTVNTTQITYGAIVPSTDSAFGGDTGTGNNLPWMRNSATSTFDMQSCTIKTVTGSDSNIYNLNVCTGTLSSTGSPTGYSANYGGGCVDSSGNPVIIKDWSLVTGGSCQAPVSFPVTGMSTVSCSYTGVSPSVASATAFTCTGTNGTYTDAALTTPVTGGVHITSFNVITAGTFCRDITTDQLQKYRCYANAYYAQQPSGGCILDYHFNWDATSAANFVQVDNRQKPKGNFLTNIVTYSADGTSFTLEDHENQGVQVPTGATSSVFCHVDQGTLMKGSQVGARILLELDQTSTLTDTLVDACVAAKNDSTSNGGNGSQLYQQLHDNHGGKQLFYLTR